MNLKFKTDPIMNIKNYIKKALGITSLESKIAELNHTNEQIKERLFSVRRSNEEISEDNRVILRHVKLLNSQFSVVSDINPRGYEPSVVLIFHRGAQEIVKSYNFNNHTLEDIHRMLEGFGRENNRIDQPRGFPSPRYRY
jgi:hypothetical protein